MAKDYAKNKGKPKSSGKSGGAMKPFLWGVFTGLLLAAIGAYMLRDHWYAAKDLYARATTADQNEKAVNESTKPVEVIPGKPMSTADVNKKYKPLEADPQTQAEWQLEELIEKQSGKEVAISSASLAAHQTESKKWVMGCAAFSSQDKADAMKAKIAFSGLQAQVKPVTAKSGAALFRVQLGPYTSKTSAEKDRQALQAQGISGCQIF